MENNETYDLANKNINKVNNYKIPLSKLQTTYDALFLLLE